MTFRYVSLTAWGTGHNLTAAAGSAGSFVRLRTLGVDVMRLRLFRGRRWWPGSRRSRRAGPRASRRDGDIAAARAVRLRWTAHPRQRGLQASPAVHRKISGSGAGRPGAQRGAGTRGSGDPGAADPGTGSPGTGPLRYRLVPAPPAPVPLAPAPAAPAPPAPAPLAPAPAAPGTGSRGAPDVLAPSGTGRTAAPAPRPQPGTARPPPGLRSEPRPASTVPRTGCRPPQPRPQRRARQRRPRRRPVPTRCRGTRQRDPGPPRQACGTAASWRPCWSVSGPPMRPRHRNP